MKKYLTLSAYARLHGVSRQRVQQLVDSGRIKVVRLTPRSPVVDAETKYPDDARTIEGRVMHGH
jgi:hypothetical protein